MEYMSIAQCVSMVKYNHHSIPPCDRTPSSELVLVCGLKFGHVFALLFCAPRLATAAATGDNEAEIREAAAVANLRAEIARLCAKNSSFRWGFLLLCRNWWTPFLQWRVRYV